MTAVEPAAAPGGVLAEEQTKQHCAVCEHELSEHDAISLRFCHATQAQALSRRCMCTTKP